MATPSKLNLDELAASIVRCFPSLNLLEQRLSLDLYRLLAEGQPVQRTELAKQLVTSVEAVMRILESWPRVFADSAGRLFIELDSFLNTYIYYPTPHCMTR